MTPWCWEHMVRVTIVGELTSITGWGQHLIHVFRYFQAHDVFVSVRSLKSIERFGAEIPSDIRANVVQARQPEPWELVIAPPTYTPTAGRKTIYFTMWESDELPGVLVNNLNKADVVIVPCEWNRTCFEKSGVTQPIFIVPLGFDPSIFRYSVPPKGAVTIFSAAGRTAHGRDRKGLDGVIRAFLAAFPYEENVRLRVKCHQDCQLPDIKDPRIEVTRKHLADLEVAKWLSESHCFVSAATGEGWGLWQLQAAAQGRPVIASTYGGLGEFLGDNNSYPVKYREAECSEHWCGKWAIPDLESVIHQMRRVHSNREEAIAIGQTAERSVRRFTWDRSCGQLHEILDALGVAPILQKSDHRFIKTRSVVDQCEERGWPATVIEFELGRNEVVFNPSHASGVWFCRSSHAGGGDRRGSRIFTFQEQDYVSLKERTWLDLLGFPGDEFEDPRAQRHGEEWAVSYTRLSRGAWPTQEIAFLNSDLSLRESWHVNYGNNGAVPKQSSKPEKNWIWFYTDGAWHFVYWLEPMTVVRVENGLVTKVYNTNNHLKSWRHGIFHGGGPPVRIGDEYWGWCHSYLPWYGQNRSRYFITNYAFSANPPFGMTRLARVPYLESMDDVTSNPCSCIICGGAVLENGIWTLSIGEADTRCVKVSIPHEQVIRNMETL